MLSDHEQRVLQEIERSLAAEAGEPRSPDTATPAPRHRSRRHRGTRRHPAIRALQAVGCLVGLLLIVGAGTAALAIAAAGILSCLAWRYWPLLRDDGGGTGTRPRPENAPPGSPHRRLGDQWLAEYLKRISKVE
jgi:Protein of unknown function (DUF3040)